MIRKQTSTSGIPKDDRPLTRSIGHKEFKNTELGRIPKEWEVVSLRDVVDDGNDIVAGPFGSNLKVSDYRPEGVPIIRLQNIKRNKFINKDIKYISPKKAEELKYHSYQVGDLVLAKLGDPIGKTCIVPPFIGKGIVVADVVRIRVSSRKAADSFIEYMLNSSICFTQLRKETIGSTRPRVNISQVRNLKLPLPPLPEQRRIAKILSTVDEAIQKVDEAIARTERLKRGLMQELLTRGIGHKKFKDSEIGRIPKEWGVVRLGEIVTHEKGRKPKTLLDRREQDTLPYLSAETLRTGIFTQWARETGEFMKVNKDDVILIWDGFYCGDSFIGFEGILSSTMIKIEPKKQSLNKHFLFYFLKARFKELNSKISGMYLKHVNKSVFESLKLPLPPLDEQQKIAKILLAVDRKLELERARRGKLERIKKGLMNDLLTGKKRVEFEG